MNPCSYAFFARNHRMFEFYITANINRLTGILVDVHGTEDLKGCVRNYCGIAVILMLTITIADSSGY